MRILVIKEFIQKVTVESILMSMYANYKKRFDYAWKSKIKWYLLRQRMKEIGF